MTRGMSVLVVVCALLLAMPAASAGTVLDFEGLTTASSTTFAAAGASNYGGFTWDSSFGLIEEATYQNNSNNTYGFPSSDYSAYNGWGELSVTTTGSPFNFDGAYFSTRAGGDSFQSNSSTTITVEGYRSGSFVSSAGMNLIATGFTYLSANLNNVDELRFISSGAGKWWLMDDFEYSSVVPLPSAAWLGLGLLGFLGAIHRIRRRN